MDLPFATLTPANVLAKLAFSDVFDAIQNGGHGTDGVSAVHHMNVESERKYDKDVAVLRFEMENKRSGRDISKSPVEHDTYPEANMRTLGMIRGGHYVLRFKVAPFAPDVGWIVGKEPAEKETHVDIFLCSRGLAKLFSLDVRTLHARFNFDLQNRAFFIASNTRSSLAELAVNGVTVDRQMHVLNQYSMRIRVDSLEYIFQYTDFASSIDFTNARADYVTSKLGAPSSVIFEMPAPRRTTRTVGQWTLGPPLGSGSIGRVFLGSNSRNEVVAVKVMLRDAQNRCIVDREAFVLTTLTALARTHADGERILRLKEAIGPNETGGFPVGSDFEEVAVILEPMVPETVSNLIGLRTVGRCRGMSIEAAVVFRDILLGLRFLHSSDWVHGDIKPRNIGVIAGRAVLLDVGYAVSLRFGHTSPPALDRGGTANYMSPERELSEYYHGADIWGVGCIGYKFIYQKAMDRMAEDYERYLDKPAAERDPNFIHLGGLIIQMLKHPWAPRLGDRTRRINVHEALEHPAWNPLLFAGP